MQSDRRKAGEDVGRIESRRRRTQQPGRRHQRATGVQKGGGELLKGSVHADTSRGEKKKKGKEVRGSAPH